MPQPPPVSHIYIYRERDHRPITVQRFFFFFTRVQGYYYPRSLSWKEFRLALTLTLALTFTPRLGGIGVSSPTYCHGDLSAAANTLSCHCDSTCVHMSTNPSTRSIMPQLRVKSWVKISRATKLKKKKKHFFFFPFYNDSQLPDFWKTIPKTIILFDL